jgi:hypothetical protein
MGPLAVRTYAAGATDPIRNSGGPAHGGGKADQRRADEDHGHLIANAGIRKADALNCYGRLRCLFSRLGAP